MPLGGFPATKSLWLAPPIAGRRSRRRRSSPRSWRLPGP
jgi:hypothetical protein